MQCRDRLFHRFDLALQRIHIRKNAPYLAPCLKQPRNIFVEELSSGGGFNRNRALVSIKERQVYGYAEAGRDDIARVPGVRKADIDFWKLSEYRPSEPLFLRLITDLER